MRAWLAFTLLGIISPEKGALGRITVLGSELEDSYFRKKNTKSRALDPLPMVRPREGTRVISPQQVLSFLRSWGRKQEGLLHARKEEEGLCPVTLGKRVQEVPEGIWCGG